MASARAQMGALRRKIGKRQKTARVASGIFSTLGTVAAFGAGQAKKAETAWGEYEAGYKELGGEGFERPKIGKGYFKGPEGEVRIGEKIYDREKIQKAGSFLGSDAAAVLSDEQRKQYLGRISPGRWDPSQFTKPAQGPHIYSGQEIVKRDPKSYEHKNPTIADFRSPSKSLQQWSVGGIRAQDYLQTNKVATGTQIPESQLSENLPTYGMSAEQRADRKVQESIWDVQKANVNKFKNQPLEDYDAMNQYRMNSYARGGDFITNGPQEILVGDNPGGRERVTIKPLPSKKRNWLESLYENNRRRKVY